MQKILRKVHLVLGPPLSGKSTFIRSNFDTAAGDIIVQPGVFLRRAVGVDRMMKDPNPNACDCTDDWVHNIMIGAFRFQKYNGGVLVLDGYPRKIEQARRMMDIVKSFHMDSQYRPYDTHIHVHVLTVSPELAEQRSANRSFTEREFDMRRIKIAASQIENVLDALISFSNHVHRVQIKYVLDDVTSKVR